MITQFYLFHMSISFSFLRSLILAATLSFVIPVVLLGLLLLAMLLLGMVPFLTTSSQLALAQMLHFLSTFGNGDVVEGVLVIGTVGSVVGVLFDSFVFYQRQYLHRS